MKKSVMLALLWGVTSLFAFDETLQSGNYRISVPNNHTSCERTQSLARSLNGEVVLEETNTEKRQSWFFHKSGKAYSIRDEEKGQSLETLSTLGQLKMKDNNEDSQKWGLAKLNGAYVICAEVSNSRYYVTMNGKNVELLTKEDGKGLTKLWQILPWETASDAFNASSTPSAVQKAKTVAPPVTTAEQPPASLKVAQSPKTVRESHTDAEADEGGIIARLLAAQEQEKLEEEKASEAARTAEAALKRVQAQAREAEETKRQASETLARLKEEELKTEEAAKTLRANRARVEKERINAEEAKRRAEEALQKLNVEEEKLKESFNSAQEALERRKQEESNAEKAKQQAEEALAKLRAEDEKASSAKRQADEALVKVRAAKEAREAARKKAMSQFEQLKEALHQ